MSIYEEAIAKIQQLPESLVIEVNDFIDFLIIQHNQNKQEQKQSLTQSLDMAETDFSDYLSNE
ncbi:DUF2281 domain-containing protein [Aphanothece hegewaldii]|uniref:DUF2281 domain-containing protein n=1 Tax=Aphanothece hegewaldii TaxID=1521625 RepID=UPI001FE514CC|nr:DUF2281 domain-containing protein [Aphanothece hegewaldii]